MPDLTSRASSYLKFRLGLVLGWPFLGLRAEFDADDLRDAF